jgi:phage I-like protein/cation transport regulator ChaB
MPYKYPSDIPDAIKDLPADAQKMWVSVFNSAYIENEGDEAKSNATAWAAVNKEYEEVDGEWVKKAMEAKVFRFADLLEGIKFKTKGGKKTSKIQLFKTGEWSHPTYGKFKITEDDLEAMDENFTASDADVVGDYQHGSLSEDPEIAKASGWVKKLINKGKELWAEVEWTEKAVEYIKNKEFRFISPEFDLNWKNPETGEKQGPTLLAFALTNRPFLKGMAAVALSEQAAKQMAEKSYDEKSQEIRDAYYSQNRTGSGSDYYSTWVQSVYPGYIIVHEEGGLFKIPYMVDGEDITFGNKTEVEVEYKEKSNKLTKPKGGGKEMELKDVREALSLSEEVDEAGVLAAIKELGEAGGKSAEDKKVLRVALKLTEEASDQDVLNRIKEMSDTAKEDKDKAAKLTDRVAKLENDQLEGERDRVIEAAIKDGKVTPVAREKWEKMYMKDPQGTTELIADLGVVIDAKETGGDGGPAGDSGAGAKLDAAVEAKMKETGSDYAVALKEVGRENPKLVEEVQ